MKTRCVYHGWVWMELVEQGWVTVTVCDPHPVEGWQIAIMWKEG